MRAIVFERTGEPRDVLALCEVPTPTVGPGQVLVAVEASPVHPADFGFIRGSYRVKPSFPQIAGLSGAGHVLATGDGVRLARGVRVAFRWPGAWAEQVAVRVERTFVVPEDIAAEVAAQFPVNPITAWGLLDVARAQPGQWLGLTAASSSVAALVGALAGERGLHVVGISRPGSLTALAAGVHGVADDEPDLAARVRAVTTDQGLAALIDGVGGPLLGKLFPALAPGAVCHRLRDAQPGAGAGPKRDARVRQPDLAGLRHRPLLSESDRGTIGDDDERFVGRHSPPSPTVANSAASRTRRLQRGFAARGQRRSRESRTCTGRFVVEPT